MPRSSMPAMHSRAPRSLDRLIRAEIAPRRARRILQEFAEHHGTDHLGATLLRAGSTTALVLLPFLCGRGGGSGMTSVQ